MSKYSSATEYRNKIKQKNGFIKEEKKNGCASQQTE
jgi:hypothetical protein